MALRQPVEFAVLLAQIAEIVRHGHRSASRPDDNLLRRKPTPVAIDVVGEPAVQRPELAVRDFG
jgi:hypothetical protein